jgi:hypothetical protein
MVLPKYLTLIMIFFIDVPITDYGQSTFISAIVALAGALVTLFLLYKKSSEAHALKLESLFTDKEKKLLDIYEKIVKSTNESNDHLADMVKDNTSATRMLENSIRSLPSELKKALKE